MEKIKIGITVGDINGIGLEVILKTVADERILNLCTPIIYGSSKVVSYHKNIVQVEFPFANMSSARNAESGKVNVVNCWQDTVSIALGKVNELGGKYALMALEMATEELKENKIDALVTAPIHKHAMQLAGFKYIGHTEFLTEKLGNGESVMLLVNDNLRVGLVTNHLPIASVAAAITTEKIMRKIVVLNDSLRVDFGIEKPIIAVLGLNPHAGDDGTIGTEEINIIQPAIEMAKARGILAMGPFAADGFFGSDNFRKFDAILAMYHDQGLVPFKTLSFGNGVNYTAGLPFVRTSPDHGTGMDIAGKNQANPHSFRQALFLAIDLVNRRKEHAFLISNQLKSRSAKLRPVEDEIIVEE